MGERPHGFKVGGGVWGGGQLSPLLPWFLRPCCYANVKRSAESKLQCDFFMWFAYTLHGFKCHMFSYSTIYHETQFKPLYPMFLQVRWNKFPELRIPNEIRYFGISVFRHYRRSFQVPKYRIRYRYRYRYRMDANEWLFRYLWISCADRESS